MKHPAESKVALKGLIFRNMLRETWIILVFWTAMMTWVISVTARSAYRVEDETPLVLGFPSWVFWGIAVPWAASTVFIFCFCLFWMNDDPLEPTPSADNLDSAPPA